MVIITFSMARKSILDLLPSEITETNHSHVYIFSNLKMPNIIGKTHRKYKKIYLGKCTKLL